jgi:HK97 family phage portal protein
MTGTGMIMMGIYGARNSASLENPALSLDDPKTWEKIGLTGESTTSGVTVNLKTGMGYPPLWRAVNLIAGDVGRLPIDPYRREKNGDKEVDRDHPSFKLLRRMVNPVMRSMTFKETIVYHALVRGNGYAAIIRDGAGRPGELLLLDPEETVPVKIVDENTAEVELWYLSYIGDRAVRISAANMFHIKGLSHDGVSGIDVLSLMGEALGIGMATRKWVGKFFGAGTHVSGVLMIPENYNEAKAANVLKEWNKTQKELGKENRVAPLRDGVKFLPLSSKPEEAEATGLMQHEIITVSQITGVPPHKLGDNSRTSYNSLEISSQEYLDDCLDRWFVEFETEANEKLLSRQEIAADSHFIEFNRKARLRMSSAERAALHEKYRGMGVESVNDTRRIENMPTIGPEGDKRHIPANWVELGAPPKPAPAPQPAPAPPAEKAPKPAKNVRNATRALIADILDKKTAIEQGKVVKACGKDGFADWSKTFYEGHGDHLLDALLPIAAVLEASGEDPITEQWREAVKTHCNARREALSACESVEKEVSGWSGADLLDLILPLEAP